MDFVKLSEQRFTAKKFDVNKKIPRDDVEKLKTILQLSPSSVNSPGRTHQKLSNEPRYRSPFIGDLTRGTF